MKRRNFFKNLFATTVGFFAVSKKTAKAQEKPKTTLRFNENRIEAFNGETWYTALIVQTDDIFLFDKTSLLWMSIPAPTAEQRIKLQDNSPGKIKEFKVGGPP